LRKWSHRYINSLVVIIPALWQVSAAAFVEAKNVQDVRASILAGRWYPKSPSSLTKSIDDFLSRADTPRLNGKLIAVIVPHAGHVYSGQVAAHAYRSFKGKRFRRIVLLGPSHHMRFRGVSVNLQSGYETPLGLVPVDQNLGRKLLGAGSYIRWLKGAHAREHSLEIQLPFLQRGLSDFQIVPILMGQQDYETCSELATTLKQVLGTPEETMILASSDLSHFHTYERAKALDSQFIKRVQTLDAKGLAQDLAAGTCEACGGGPVITTLLTAQKMGANRAIILSYANSGDVTGDHRRVVGYMSAALIKSSDKGPHR
jgi:AmmeMemoRadiSam system protein B